MPKFRRTGIGAIERLHAGAGEDDPIMGLDRRRSDVSEPRWLDCNEQRAWRAFIAMHAQLSERLRRSLQQDAGLSLSDYAVLVILSEATDHRLRAFEIVEALQWEKSRLSHHLRRMEQRGLIERVECESDGRGAFVTLSPKGLQAIESAAPGHIGEVRRSFLDLLSTAQVDALVEIGETVLSHLDHLEEDGSRAGVKPC